VDGVSAMSFPRYPAYKDSGVEWLGEVPEHWDALPLRRLIREVTSGTSVNAIDEPAGPDRAGVLKTSCVYTGDFRPEENKAIIESELDRASCPVEAGCLVVSRMNTPDLVGAAGLVKVDAPCLYLPDRLWQVRFRDCDPSFMNYWCKSSSYRSQVQLACSGTSSSMQNLSQDNFYSFIAPVPPSEEQRAAATFLDHETAKIDTLIAEQQRLIELLQEKRQAVISHAVTKGLSPDAPMKDSGVEWLGEVPVHWAVSAVGHRYEVRLGKMLDEKRVTREHLGPYLRNTDVQWESINIEELPEMDFEPSEYDRYSLRQGDLLVCEGGEVGRSAIWESQLSFCFYQKALHRLRPYNQRSDDCRFQLYVMRMACSMGVFEASSGKATINHLPAESFRRYRFAYPPLDEQIAICEHLSQVCSQMNELEAEAQSLVSTLQERRSALISAAVTGQIDVRGLVPEASAA
jgi:type I restriction enzyme S subunit